MVNLGVTAFVLSSGCATQPAQFDDASEATEERTEGLLVEPSSIWPYAAIPVCWDPTGEQMGATFQQRRADVKSVIENTWAAVSAIKFSGWGTCGADVKSGIVIYTKNNIRSFVDNIGYRSESASRVTLDLNDWRDGFVPAHEFGHLLGFGHEQGRSDTPEECKDNQINDAPSVSDTGMPIGVWDKDSIMNYCRPTHTALLSSGDIIGAQAFYGANWGNLVAVSGQCLDLPALNTAPGTGLEVYACHNSVNQKWRFSSTLRGEVRGMKDTCLRRASDGKSVIGSCQAAPTVEMTALELRGFGNYCLDVAPEAKPGAQVVAYRCHGGPNQKWFMSSKGEVKTEAGLCLEVKGYDPHGILQVGNCSGGANQQWHFENGGSIRPAFGASCVDIAKADLPGLSSHASARVGMWECDMAKTRQKWRVRGAVQDVATGQCMTLDPSTNKLRFAPCLGKTVSGTAVGDSNQRWTWTPTF